MNALRVWGGGVYESDLFYQVRYLFYMFRRNFALILPQFF